MPLLVTPTVLLYKTEISLEMRLNGLSRLAAGWRPVFYRLPVRHMFTFASYIALTKFRRIH
jgi:hypothetical protein